MTFKPLKHFNGVSHYSYLGSSSIEDMVDRFKTLNIDTASICELGNLNSSMEFYTYANKKGIKPILGIQAYLEDTWSTPEFNKNNETVTQYGTITVHFKTYEAYQYFCKISKNMEDRSPSTSNVPTPILKMSELEQIKDLVTIGTSGLDGIIAKFVTAEDYPMAEKIYLELLSLVGNDNLFCEIMPYVTDHYWVKPMYGFKRDLIREGGFVKRDSTELTPGGDSQRALNIFLLAMAKKHGGLPVPSLSTHFANLENQVIQDTKLQTNKLDMKYFNSNYVIDSARVAFFFIKNYGITIDNYNEWLNNLDTWSDNFKDFKLPTSNDRWVLPDLNEDSLVYVKRVIDKVGRMKWDNPTQVARLKEEVRVLKYNGKIDLLPYFKPIVEVVDWCRECGIPVNLRGSSSGSFLVYLLGLSGISPLDYGLSFERFINEGRIKANNIPDLDLDVGQRDKVINHLKEKYGDNFMQLSVDVKLKIKSAIKDCERAVLGQVRPETEDLCKAIPDPPQGSDEYEYVFGTQVDDVTITEGIFYSNTKLQEYAEKNPEIWESVKQMLGILRNKSGHPCAVVIAPEPIRNYIPITKIGESYVTGFSPKSVELAGLVKYDILSVNTLDDIGGCLKILKEEKNIDLDPYNLPEDPDTYKQFMQGHTETVFQFNTPTVIPYLKSTRPDSIAKLSNVTALARPGTLDAKAEDGRTLAEVYVARANGESITYIHRDLEPILNESYGIALYQEQSLRIFTEIGGMTNEEADEVRRGIGKKIKSVLDTATAKLKIKCLERGWTEHQSELLMDQIMASARYSFNKSHAASYAKIAYACQYLKTKYPLEWWTTVLTNAKKNELPKFWPHCGDLVLMPDVNLSGDGFKIEGDNIRAPINILTGIGETAYSKIIETKPYKNIQDFVVKTKGRSLNKSVICKLIVSGLLDSLFEDKSLGLEDKLYQFMKTKAMVEGTSKVDPVPEEYVNLDSLKQFLVKKQLMSVISEDLRKFILPKEGLTSPKDSETPWESKGIKYIDGKQLDFFKKQLRNNRVLQNQYGDSFATVSYVIDESTKTYQNKSKQMTKILIDTGGDFRETVVWPSYGESISDSGFKNQIVKINWRWNKKREEFGIGQIKIVNI